MKKKTFRRSLPACALGAGLLLLPGSARAQYDYGRGGGGGGGGSGESGFLVVVEGGIANPRNTDNVVATDIAAGAVVPLVPSWEDDASGRLALGWGWGNGSRILAGYWGFATDVEATGSGSFAAAIGPPIFDGADYHGDVIGFFASRTEIEAETADLEFGVEHEATDRLMLDWLVGMRYARFEEIHRAGYDEAPAPIGFDSFVARKSNEGEMVGARAGFGGRYRLGPISFGARLALSFLDGTLTAASSLTPSGSANSTLGSSFAGLEDDSRSGRILELDTRLTWHHPRDRVRVWGGWEQAEWDEIAADLVRNFPGTVARLAERDSVTFSSYKLGVQVRF